MLRAIWSFVIVCLVAASAVAPRAEVRDPRSQQLQPAPAGLVVVGRRELASAPDVRLPLFVTVEPPDLAAPEAATALCEARALAGLLVLVVTGSSARGPPIA